MHKEHSPESGSIPWSELSLETIQVLLTTNYEEGLSENMALLRLRRFGSSPVFIRHRYFSGTIKAVLGFIFMIGIIMGCYFNMIFMAGALLILLLAWTNDYAQSNKVKVLRDGKISKIRRGRVVIGDVIELDAGDIIPQNVRLLQPDGNIQYNMGKKHVVNRGPVKGVVVKK